MSSYGLRGGVEGWRAWGAWGAGISGGLALQVGSVFAVLVPRVVRGDKRPLEGLRMMAVDR